MPALPSPGAILKVVVTVTDDNDLASINRFFLGYAAAAPTAAQLTTLANGAIAQWTTNMAPLYHPSSSLTNVTIEDLQSSTGAAVSVASAVAGTRAGTRLSAAACAVIAEKITRRYRGGHPRVYLACGVEADLQTRQTWTAAAIAAFQTGWLDFIGGMDTFTWGSPGSLNPFNVSYYQGFTNFTFPSGRTRAIPKLRVTPVIDPITSYTCRANVGSQRRRNLSRS